MGRRDRIGKERKNKPKTKIKGLLLCCCSVNDHSMGDSGGQCVDRLLSMVTAFIDI